ncbi:transcription cofactor vestigial-like protein 1 isoform X1 [Kogia breviceps]|uniref:transcription cofactor vestigial-like protein 1 isoform X1 n=1 Tax=Kogia breviceps TaxID=27615 RepID=UPI0034D2DB56
MEEVRKTAVQMQSPIKTEWNSRCVLFTYFQGDISSVVDEHFSRALGNVKSPQGLSPSSQSRDVILRNDSDMPPNQWRFSSQWTKPQPEVSFANGAASYSLSGSGPMAMDQYPVSLTGSPYIQPGELRHFSSLASSSFPEPGYPYAFSTGHWVPEPQPDAKYEPLLSLLQPERCLTHPPESASWEDGHSAQAARSMGLLFSLPSGSAHFKKIYFPPEGGLASASLAVEKYRILHFKVSKLLLPALAGNDGGKQELSSEIWVNKR